MIIIVIIIIKITYLVKILINKRICFGFLTSSSTIRLYPGRDKEEDDNNNGINHNK